MVFKELKSTCPTEAIIYEFSDDEIALWLHLHNDHRNKIANGSISGFDSASRMARSVWRCLELKIYLEIKLLSTDLLLAWCELEMELGTSKTIVI